jgi:hypothetical protein
MDVSLVKTMTCNPTTKDSLLQGLLKSSADSPVFWWYTFSAWSRSEQVAAALLISVCTPVLAFEDEGCTRLLVAQWLNH